MKILFINPNSTESMTDKVRETAEAIVPHGVEVLAWTSTEGPPSIQGEADGQRALPGLLNLVGRGNDEGADAIVLACFDDTGIREARAASVCPVLGIGQAAFHASMLAGRTFSVVTTLSVSIPVIEANIAYCGVGSHCRRVRASEVPVLALEEPGSAASDKVSAEVGRALADDQCEAIVLGCAGMTDLVQRLRAEHGVPVIDGVAAAAALAPAVASLG